MADLFTYTIWDVIAGLLAGTVLGFMIGRRRRNG